jgi:hypothetical protein
LRGTVEKKAAHRDFPDYQDKDGGVFHYQLITSLTKWTNFNTIWRLDKEGMRVSRNSDFFVANLRMFA